MPRVVSQRGPSGNPIADIAPIGLKGSGVQGQTTVAGVIKRMTGGGIKRMTGGGFAGGHCGKGHLSRALISRPGPGLGAPGGPGSKMKDKRVGTRGSKNPGLQTGMQKNAAKLAANCLVAEVDR